MYHEIFNNTTRIVSVVIETVCVCIQRHVSYRCNRLYSDELLL